MVDESIKAVLEERGDVDFAPLYELMEQSGLIFKNQKLRGVLGIATADAIYLDLDKFRQYTDESKCFVILHEMAHGKRIERLGKQWLIDRLSLEDFEEFAQAIIREEILADRYASYALYALIGHSFPRSVTQQLHLPDRQEDYKFILRTLFGKVQHSEENYDKLFDTYLIND